MDPPKTFNKQGFEIQFAVNHPAQGFDFGIMTNARKK